MYRPTDEDMATDLTQLADDVLSHAPGCWWTDPDRSHKGVCTCGADDYAETAGAAMRRALYAEAELARLRQEAASQRRKGRVDACRVLNEAAARFPAASNVLRECVRDIERMDR